MKQLTLSDRVAIEAGLCTGKTLKKIAEDIGRNPTTISREIKTNRSYIHGSFFLMYVFPQNICLLTLEYPYTLCSLSVQSCNLRATHQLRCEYSLRSLMPNGENARRSTVYISDGSQAYASLQYCIDSVCRANEDGNICDCR